MKHRLRHLSEYPKRLEANFRDKRVLRYQKEDGGVWYDVSGGAFARRCLEAAQALFREGICPGDKIGFYSPNAIDALSCEIGGFMLRAISVPLYATSSREQVEFAIKDAGVKILFVGGQEQYDVAWALQQDTQCLKRIIYLSREVKIAPEDSTSWSYEAFIGEGIKSVSDTEVYTQMSEADPEEVALIMYTSGTSGQSKGVVLKHRHLAYQVEAHVEMFSFLSSEDVSMSFLPHSHIFEKTWLYYCLYIGCTSAILSNPKTILEALQGILPTVMCNVPRFWEKVYIGVQDKIAQMPKMLQRVMRHAITLGERYHLEYRNEGRPMPWGQRVMYRLYEATLFAKLKRVLGLQRGRFFPVAGASLAPALNRFLQSVSIPICYGYGLSESTATVCCFPRRGYNIDSIGEVVPHVEVRISETDGEIQLKGPTIMEEYYNNPEANANAFTSDGFFRTGDAGRLEGRTLFFTERLKDLFKTANGKYVAPQMLEGLIMRDPIVEQIAVIGDGYKFVSALVYPNWDLLLSEAKRLGINIERDRDELASAPEVNRLIVSRLDEQQREVSSYERIKRVALLKEPFSIESGTLTPTLKIKRKIVNARYSEVIAKMYLEE